jgi:pyroglutamyl-peptidase
MVQRPRSTVLLTGFDPFGDQTINPSWLAVQALHRRQILGHRVMAAQLPTVFEQSSQVLGALIRKHKPSLVLCVGQAGGRQAISLERVAINVDDAHIADNAGAQPIDTPVIRNGPAAYFTSLPIRAMLQALQSAGIAAEISQTAGTFVCNHVFYALMHLLATSRGLNKVRGGFVHMPFLPEQGEPSMALDEMVRSLRLAVRSALATRQDIAAPGGACH